MTHRPKRRTAPYRVAHPWTAVDVRALRQHLGLTQQAMSTQLGMRQQTISEWEIGKHQPRGASLTLLNVIAEQSGFPYRTE